MLLKLSWNRSYHIEILDPEKILLIDEQSSKMLTGRVFPLLAPLLNGQYSVQELEEKLAHQVFRPEISYALELCKAKGFIIEEKESPPEQPEQVAFWHSLNVGYSSVQNRLRDTQVAVTSLGINDKGQMMEALELLNIQTEEKGNFQVILTDDYLRPELAEINLKALEHSHSWMLIRPIGNTVWIGPVFRPGESGCWECLRQRLQSNRMVESFLERLKAPEQSVSGPLSALPSIVRTAFDLAATEIAKALILGSQSPLNGAVLTFDSVKLETKRHILTRRPQCTACGIPAQNNSKPKPVKLKSCPKQIGSEAGSRSLTPESTYARLEKHISLITGVVRTLESFAETSNKGLIYSYAAGHNFALSHMDIHFVLENMRGRSGGKGTTNIQAKVSAIAEAIERYSGVYRGDEISSYASFVEIEDDAIYPNDIMLFSDSQYQERQSWNIAHQSGFHQVPKPFDPERKIHWTPVWSLTNGGFKYVPSAYCYFGHPDLQQWSFCTSDSNGNAAGNSVEEAILQGFMELVERDAVALFWYNRIQCPGLDLDSFDDPYIQALRSYYRAIERDLWVVDITSDLGIPVFAAVSSRIDGPTKDILVGFGAHLTPRVALLRALTEVNQFLPAVQRRDAQGNTIYYFPEQEAITWWKTATLKDNPYLLAKPSIIPKTQRVYSDVSQDDIKADVEYCLDIARNHELEVFVLDQTQPDINLNVVKVIVPGLRHFWKRFGPGRLYDVPVKLGWLEQSYQESQLNPVGIFF